VEKILRTGQLLFGISIMAFGLENLFCARLGLTVRGVPWFPTNSILGYLTGVALIMAGLSVVANVRARLSATLLGILFLLYALLLEASKVVATPLNLSLRTVFFEALAIGAAALTLAATLPAINPRLPGNFLLDKLRAAGPCLFGVSSIVFGIDHFLILGFIASLVPAWMGGGMFWAYLTGAALVAAGISIVAKRLDQWAAGLLGLMFLLWFFLLHSPRVMAAVQSHSPNTPDECSSAFIALAMCGGSWICALHARQRRTPK
jgi:uncharacterized membrane protein YphA (DoxX/SURF4 family)